MLFCGLNWSNLKTYPRELLCGGSECIPVPAGSYQDCEGGESPKSCEDFGVGRTSSLESSSCDLCDVDYYMNSNGECRNCDKSKLIGC